MGTTGRMASASRPGMMAGSMKACGPTDANTARGVSAKRMVMFMKENFLLEKQKAKVCSRPRKVTFTRANGSRVENGARECASGLTAANTLVTGREAKSTGKDA